VEIFQNIGSRATRRRALRRGLLILSVTAAMTSAACSSSASGSGSSARAGSTLTYADNIGPITMNPLQMGNGTAGVYAMPAYDSLITIEPDGKLTPDLATKWEYVPGSGNTQFEMTIRNGVRFSDGTIMTAQDVVNSLEYALKNAYFKFTMGAVTSITAPTADTVKLTLSTANPELPYAFDQYWQQGDIIAPAGLANPSLLLKETLGAGPYMLSATATISGVQYTYVPNPYYWDKSAIHWKQVVVKVFSDTDSALQTLESGQAQVAVGNVPIAEAIKDNPSLKVLSNATQEAGIVIEDEQGTVVPALGKLAVRQAMNYGIDRVAVNKILSGNLGEPLDQIQGQGFPGYDPSLASYYSYNPAKAKQLLASAGYPNGFAMTLLTQQGTTTDLLAQLFAGQMAKIGVRVTIRDDSDVSQFLADAAAKKYPATAPLLNMGSPYFVYEDDFAASGANLWNIFNVNYPSQNALVAKALAAAPTQATKLWQQIYAWMTTNATWIPISQSPNIYFITSSVSAAAPGQAETLSPVDVIPNS
jgi:peptide/nickel transport system substrate-binding protein